MSDRVSAAKRSEIMRSVKHQDTGPEIALRKMLHRLGYRYKLHAKDLPGKPDIAFPGRRKVIFVHGCFWHGHRCRYGRLPQSRLEYWQPKIQANRTRDARKANELRRAGWKIAVVWQCELKTSERTLKRVVSFLDERGPAAAKSRAKIQNTRGFHGKRPKTI